MLKGECVSSYRVGGVGAYFDIPLFPIIRWQLFYDGSLLIRVYNDVFKSPLEFSEAPFFFVDALHPPSS